jgi:tRNA(fMet)-specific endonuclease VapC
MGLVLDADVIIRGEKGTFDLRAWLAAHPGEQLELAAITVAELWHGIERATAAQRATRELYVRTVLERVPVIPYTEITAFEHARLWAFLESSGKMIGYYDLIVAATALERGSAVATFNQRHFAQIPNLKVIKPRLQSLRCT